MKHISTQLARTIWLFPPIDLNPNGRAIVSDITIGLVDRYQFLKAPTYDDIVNARIKGEGLKFLDGTFKTATGQKVAVELTIHRDGVMLDTRSNTDDGDAMIEDALGWLHQDLGLADPRSLSIKKIYVSSLNLTLDRSLNLVNPGFERFASHLQETTKSNVPRLDFEVGSIAFWIDPEAKVSQTGFRLERAEGVPFSENRYFSIAPLQTDEHLSALVTLEKMLSKKR